MRNASTGEASPAVVTADPLEFQAPSLSPLLLAPFLRPLLLVHRLAHEPVATESNSTISSCSFFMTSRRPYVTPPVFLAALNSLVIAEGEKVPVPDPTSLPVEAQPDLSEDQAPLGSLVKTDDSSGMASHRSEADAHGHDQPYC